jgi:hypothetical protein
MKLILNEGLLPPIEIEIKGATYPVNPITRKVWKALRLLQERITTGDAEAIYEQLPLLLNLPSEVQDGLEFREVLLIVKHVTQALYAPFTGVAGEEKKLSGPGLEPSA